MFATERTPCADISRIGLKDCESGQSILYILAWYALILAVEPKELTHETAEDFQVLLTRKFLGHEYHTDHGLLDPRQFGHIDNRKRVWVKLRHKAHTSMAKLPRSTIITLINILCVVYLLAISFAYGDE